MVQHDAAWFEAQYNNRARVTDAPGILVRWAQASELARSRMTCVLDVAYGDDPGETLDVFPARQSGAPVLVYIHGGYWRALDKSEHSFVAPAFVQSGAMVVVPNYALCPAVTIEAIALQTAQALAWVWRHAAKYGGDPSRIHVIGHSAGGHLAAMLLCCRWKTVAPDLPGRLLAGAMSLSGVFDLAPLRHAPFLQADLALDPAAVRRLSPAGFPRPRGPLLALVGADESAEFLRQNQLIRDRWGAAAVPVCQALPGHNHFTVLQDLVDPAGGAHRHALRLLGLPVA
jgi:arylformamidase